MKIIDNLAEKPKFILIYGGSGTGKTHLAGTIAKKDVPTLDIDIDQGCATLGQLPQSIQDNITVASFDTFGDLDGAYQAVAKNTPDNWNKAFGVNAVEEPFRAVIWDGWSILQDTMKEEIRKKDPEMSGGGRLKLRKGLEIQDWGKLNDLNRLSINSFKKLPVTQIFICQEETNKDDLTGAIYGGPAIFGKLSQDMPSFFDIVIRCYTSTKGEWVATTQSKGRFPAKTRFGVPKEVVLTKESSIYELL